MGKWHASIVDRETLLNGHHHAVAGNMHVADRVQSEQGKKLVRAPRAEEVLAAQADRIARAAAVQVLHDVAREVGPVLCGLAERLVGTARGLLLDEVIGQRLDHVIVGVEIADVSLVIGVVDLDEHEAAADAAITRREAELVAIDFLKAHEPLGAGPGCGLRRLQHRLELDPPLGVAIVQHHIIGISIHLALEQGERIAAARGG